MNQREEILSSMPVGRALYKLAIPSIAAMLINMIYSMTDTFFIGKLNDTTALAAIMVVMPILMILGAIGAIFGTGGAVIISMALGKKDYENVSKTFITTIVSSGLIAIVFSLLTSLFPANLLRTFGASELVMTYALQYARIIFIGNFFTIMNNVLNSLIRSEGATNISTIGMVIGALVNIVLDPLFIFYFDMGISGAALATTLGALVSAAYYINFYMRGKSVLSIDLKSYKYKLNKLKHIITLGVPSAMLSILMSLSFSLFNILGAKYGDTFIASMGLSTRVVALAIMILIGLSNGYQPLAGYAYGAGNFERLKKATLYTLITSVIISTASYLVFTNWGEKVLSLFSNVPETIIESVIILKAVSTFLPLMGVIITAITLFTALGKAKESMIIALTRQVIVLIPAMFILPLFFDKYGLIYAQPLSDLVSFIVCLILMFKQTKSLGSSNQTHKIAS
ncbi:MATE family efflux transporter [Acidaminobacter sp. JC074]|uniref:MATE family efflux transporter n=1 Tax=Acidaminobacter sp. JC074 TaxID=2530199 RepID=UPI001F0E38A3|nr:MATE family efflux transporter [Acidaminobacter sp. JC074]